MTDEGPLIIESPTRSHQAANAAPLQPLIVIVGLPRSGTTWLAKIFDSHPDTFYCHEPDSRGRLGNLPFAPDPADSATYAEIVRKFANDLPNARDIRVIGKLPLFPKSYDVPGGYLARRALIAAGKLLSKVVRAPRVPVIARKKVAKTVVWKSIESTSRLGTLAHAMPEARFIHIVRHPCGYADSILRGYTSHRFTSSTPPWDDVALIELLGETTQAQRYAASVGSLQSRTDCERLAWLWLVQNEKAFDECRSLNNVTIVRYEDLCERPVDACRELFAKVGLTWPQQTQSFVEYSTSTHDSSYYAVSKDPLRAAHAWRDRLDRDSARMVTELVAPSSIWRWYAMAQIDERFEARALSRR